MDIRQVAQSFGAALSAMTSYPLAQNYSTDVALVMSAILHAMLALLVLVGVKNPPHPDTSSLTVTANPYRSGKCPMCIHIAPALLPWPRSMMGAYILVWLLSVGYADGTTGVIVMISQLLDAGS